MIIRKITPADDSAVCTIIRKNLESYKLDIPGTAYFDKQLEHLSTYYDASPETREYFVLTSDDGEILGCGGYEKLPYMDSCAELQKLYLCDKAKGQGNGSQMLAYMENAARMKGFSEVYLETHSCLKEAVLLYERKGYRLIDRPDFVVHSTMDRFYVKSLA